MGTERSLTWPLALPGWSVSGRRGAVADDARVEKSDPAKVARKPANGGERTPLELGERRAGAEGNTNGTPTCRTPSRGSVPMGLERVRVRARLDKKERFTALLHHVDVDLLRSSFLALKRKAAPGVDGLTWEAV
jgi:RNA-directed DNA polymerase